MSEANDKALEGVPFCFLVRLGEAYLAASSEDKSKTELSERIFGGVSLKMMVNSHWTGFERFMLVGRDWQCGFNLSSPALDEEACCVAFGTRLVISNAAINGKKGFARDMTVLRMTFSDWKLDHQTT